VEGVKPFLEQKGFYSFDLRKNANRDKIIPVSWLNKDEMQLKRLANESAYELVLVRHKEKHSSSMSYCQNLMRAANYTKKS
jgi:hypothetical protein